MYEELKELALLWRRARGAGAGGGGEPVGLSPAEASACGASSKVLSGLATYPTQVIKSRLQQRQEGRAVRYAGLADALRTTLRREGAAGLYRGLLPHLAKTAPNSAITFMVYEGVLSVLGRLS